MLLTPMNLQHFRNEIRHLTPATNHYERFYSNRQWKNSGTFWSVSSIKSSWPSSYQQGALTSILITAHGPS